LQRLALARLSISLGHACCCCVYGKYIFVPIRQCILSSSSREPCSMYLSSECMSTRLQHAIVYKGSGYVIHALPGYLPLSAWLSLAYSLDRPYNDPYYHNRFDSLSQHNNITIPTAFKYISSKPPRPSLRNFSLHHWLQNLQWF
jgi:hypothetical protein